MFKTILLAGLASVVLAMPVQAKEWKEIRIASEGAYPPFNYMSPDGKLPEIMELTDHPWFIGVQFHPELKSRPFNPHPLFASFIAAARDKSRLV